MTDSITKETGLDDLKRAIESIGEEPKLRADESLLDNTMKISVWNRRRAEAWRTAFEWRDSFQDVWAPAEYHEGMRLIREKLK